MNDKKLGVSSTNTTVDYFNPQVVSAQDYYPFGMLQPGRSVNVGGYRYGFNGKENDNEVKGEGNQQDYGMRIYDPRLGKFLSVDPLTKDYPWYTPYQFAGDGPIWAIDLDGAESKISISKSGSIYFQKVVTDKDVQLVVNNGSSARAMQRLDEIVAFIRKRVNVYTDGLARYSSQADVDDQVNEMIRSNLTIRNQNSIGQVGPPFSINETTVVDFDYSIFGDEKDAKIEGLKKDIVGKASQALSTYTGAFDKKGLGFAALSYTLKAASAENLKSILVDEAKDLVVGQIEKQVVKIVGEFVAKRLMGVVANVLDPLELNRGASTDDYIRNQQANLNAEVRAQVLTLFLFGLNPLESLKPASSEKKERLEEPARKDGTSVKSYVPSVGNN